jgi:hypothetical protein
MQEKLFNSADVPLIGEAELFGPESAQLLI